MIAAFVQNAKNITEKQEDKTIILRKVDLSLVLSNLGTQSYKCLCLSHWTEEKALFGLFWHRLHWSDTSNYGGQWTWEEVLSSVFPLSAIHFCVQTIKNKNL